MIIEIKINVFYKNSIEFGSFMNPVLFMNIFLQTKDPIHAITYLWFDELFYLPACHTLAKMELIEGELAAGIFLLEKIVIKIAYI